MHKIDFDQGEKLTKWKFSSFSFYDCWDELGEKWKEGKF